jgi:hypothetical protein
MWRLFLCQYLNYGGEKFAVFIVFIRGPPRARPVFLTHWVTQAADTERRKGNDQFRETEEEVGGEH